MKGLCFLSRITYEEVKLTGKIQVNGLKIKFSVTGFVSVRCLPQSRNPYVDQHRKTAQKWGMK